jgi:hypothetical protein
VFRHDKITTEETATTDFFKNQAVQTSANDKEPVAYPGIFFLRGVSANSVGDRGQREQGSGGGSPLIRGFTQLANE